MDVTLLQRLLDATRRRGARRDTVKALSALSDRSLKDIGIHRSEIVAVADERSKSTPSSPERHEDAAVPARGTSANETFGVDARQWRSAHGD